MSNTIAVLIRQLEGHRPVSMVLTCNPTDERDKNHTDIDHLHAKAAVAREDLIAKFPEFMGAEWHTDIHHIDQD